MLLEEISFAAFCDYSSLRINAEVIVNAKCLTDLAFELFGQLSFGCCAASTLACLLKQSSSDHYLVIMLAHFPTWASSLRFFLLYALDWIKSASDLIDTKLLLSNSILVIALQ